MAVQQYIIGDIHGCFNELLALETKIKCHAKKANANHLIISLGDLIDRGPDSAKVVKHFREGAERGTHASIMGNHEQMMMRNLIEFAPANFKRAHYAPPPYLKNAKELFANGKGLAKYLKFSDYRTYFRLLWVGQGGSRTLESWGCNPEKPATWRIPPEDLRFIASLPLIWQNKSIILTHALPTKETIKAARKFDKSQEWEKHEDDLFDVTWNRKPPTERPDDNRICLSGHSVVKRVKRLKKLGCIQLDTGCHRGKRLSAYCPQTDQIMSVAGYNDESK